jgi:nitroreductase
MIDLLLKIRSTRLFSPQKIETAKIEKLVQSALLSPTSRNLHSCEFVLIEDEVKISKLSKSKPHGASLLTGAPLAIVLIGNTETTDVWIEDASIAAIDIQLEAESQELGSCWVQIRVRKYSENQIAGEYIAALLDIPHNYEVLAIIAVGYKTSTSENYTLESLNYSRVHKEVFQEQKDRETRVKDGR